MKQVDRALQLVERCKETMDLPPMERVAEMVLLFPDIFKSLRALSKRDQRLIELRNQLRLAVSELRKALWDTQDPTEPGFKGAGRLAVAQRKLDALLYEVEIVISQDEV